MSLTDIEKENVKLWAREIAFEVNKEIVTEHIKSCPYGKKLFAIKYGLIGLCIGIGIAGGWQICGIGIMKLLTIL